MCQLAPGTCLLKPGFGGKLPLLNWQQRLIVSTRVINLVAVPPRVNMTDAEATAEAELREWASGQKVTMKTIYLLAKEGFNSMEALALLDGDDLVQTKIARGQQKLLFSAIQPLQHTQSNMAAETADTCGDETARSTAADGQMTESGGRPNEGGDGQAIAAGILTTGADGRAPQTAWRPERTGCLRE